MKKFLLGLAPLFAVAAFGIAPSSAGAAACRIVTLNTNAGGQEATCNEPPSTTSPANLRETEEGAATSPISTNFATNGLLVNTKGKLRLKAKISGVAVTNENPIGDAFFGLNLESNPVSSAAVCRAATGMVTFADIQHASPSAVYDGTSAWPFTLVSNSAACSSETRGTVIIREVTLLFATLGASETPVIASGTMKGVYEQPGTNCPAGGIKLNTAQPGLTTEPATTSPEVDNSTTGEAAYICFVSANNYVYPTTAPTWTLTGAIWKD
jgi:hypothetical protein